MEVKYKVFVNPAFHKCNYCIGSAEVKKWPYFFIY